MSERKESLFNGNNIIDVAKRIRDAINSPEKSATYSELGGAGRESIFITISLDKKETWINKILENSRYCHFMIDADGKIKQLSGNKVERFRQTRAKSINEVIQKINKYVASQIKTNGVGKQVSGKGKWAYVDFTGLKGVKSFGKKTHEYKILNEFTPEQWNEYTEDMAFAGVDVKYDSRTDVYKVRRLDVSLNKQVSGGMKAYYIKDGKVYRRSTHSFVMPVENIRWSGLSHKDIDEEQTTRKQNFDMLTERGGRRVPIGWKVKKEDIKKYKEEIKAIRAKRPYVDSKEACYLTGRENMILESLGLKKSTPIGNRSSVSGELRNENELMKVFLHKNGIECTPRFTWTGSMKGTWRLYNKTMRWTSELIKKFTSLGFVDFDGRPLNQYSGNGGHFHIDVRNPELTKQIMGMSAQAGQSERGVRYVKRMKGGNLRGRSVGKQVSETNWDYSKGEQYLKTTNISALDRSLGFIKTILEGNSDVAETRRAINALKWAEQNPHTRHAFFLITGIKLPKTQKETQALLEKMTGLPSGKQFVTVGNQTTFRESFQRKFNNMIEKLYRSINIHFETIDRVNKKLARDVIDFYNKIIAEEIPMNISSFYKAEAYFLQLEKILSDSKMGKQIEVAPKRCALFKENIKGLIKQTYGIRLSDVDVKDLKKKLYNSRLASWQDKLHYMEQYLIQKGLLKKEPEEPTSIQVARLYAKQWGISVQEAHNRLFSDAKGKNVKLVRAKTQIGKSISNKKPIELEDTWKLTKKEYLRQHPTRGNPSPEKLLRAPNIKDHPEIKRRALQDIADNCFVHTTFIALALSEHKPVTKRVLSSYTNLELARGISNLKQPQAKRRAIEWAAKISRKK
ncbi:MAG: hypothetical protein PHX21_12990 [bacterium]|nr:hypothetical protein [bacterium]